MNKDVTLIHLMCCRELQRNDEVKTLIRLGVPHELRAQVWGWMVGMRTMAIRYADGISGEIHPLSHVSANATF